MTEVQPIKAAFARGVAGVIEIAPGEPTLDAGRQYERSVHLQFYAPAMPQSDNFDRFVARVRADGISPRTTVVATSSTGSETTVIWAAALAWVLKPVVEGIARPTAEAVGEAIRDSLRQAARCLRQRVLQPATLRVVVEASGKRVCFELPPDENRADSPAWDAMLDELDARPDATSCRYWIDGRWVTR